MAHLCYFLISLVRSGDFFSPDCVNIQTSPLQFMNYSSDAGEFQRFACVWSVIEKSFAGKCYVNLGKRFGFLGDIILDSLR